MNTPSEIFSPEPSRISYLPIGLFIAFLLTASLVSALLHPSVAPVPVVAAQVSPGNQVVFSPAEQANIFSYRQLLEALAARHYLPRGVADGLAAANDNKPSDQQVYLTGWRDGQPILTCNAAQGQNVTVYPGS
jgi:hypothetical protein